MCNVCGHVSRKQNMLIYHKFVKHNITPPAMYTFPRCKECSFLALSPLILQKHMATHGVTKFMCNECNAPFTSTVALLSHSQQTGHQQEKVVKEEKTIQQDPLKPQWCCRFCDKRFFSENILNTHMKRSHEEEMKVDLKTDVSVVKAKDKIKIISDVQVSCVIFAFSLEGIFGLFLRVFAYLVVCVYVTLS